MSDPLTALVHAVQVLNLLKALILKNLRERQEAAAEGEYSPFSSCPTERRGEDDLDGDHAMDLSGELREMASDDSCNVNYCNNSEDDARSDIEDCFFKRLEWKGHVADLMRDSVSLDFSSSDPTTAWTYSELNIDPRLSISSRKQGNPRMNDNELNAEVINVLKCMEDDDQVELKGAASENSYLPPCL